MLQLNLMLGGAFIGLVTGHGLNIVAQHSSITYDTHYEQITEFIGNANTYFYLNGVLLRWCERTIIFDFKFPDVTQNLYLRAKRTHD